MEKFSKKIPLLKQQLFFKFLFAYQGLTNRELIMETKALASVLESSIFPSALLQSKDIISIVVMADKQRLQIESEEESTPLKGTFELTKHLTKIGIKSLKLDTKLEQGQIVEALTVLFHAYPCLATSQAKNTDQNIHNRHLLAQQLLTDKGLNKFCAAMTIDVPKKTYTIAYSYCELFYTHSLKQILQRFFNSHNHRGLFSLAPKAGFATFLLLFAHISFWGTTRPGGMMAGFLASLAFGCAITYLLLTMASIVYDKEHRDLLLNDLNRGLEQKIYDRTKEILSTQDVTIFSLTALAETRDNETGAHINRTRRYVKTLAQLLRSHPKFASELDDDKTIDLLYRSAPLHDIGKVGIPDSILRKSGLLTEEEFEIMKKHPQMGGDALCWAEQQLGENSFLKYAREIAYHHHEKWDGTGYPYGLKGDDIPISARLMALADVFDALVSERVYKVAFPYSKALNIIEKSRGSHFDPDIVDIFIKNKNLFIDISKKYSETANT